MEHFRLQFSVNPFSVVFLCSHNRHHRASPHPALETWTESEAKSAFTLTFPIEAYLHSTYLEGKELYQRYLRGFFRRLEATKLRDREM